MNDEADRLMAEGGTDAATPKLKKYATGEHLDQLVETLAWAKQEGLHADGQETRLWTGAQGIGSPKRVDLVQCIDRSSMALVDKKGKPFDDGVEQTKMIQSYQVHLVDDQWKVAIHGTTLLNDWDRSPCDGDWEKDA